MQAIETIEDLTKPKFQQNPFSMNDKSDEIGTTSNVKSFEKPVATFIDHIESLVNSLPLVLGTILATRQKAQKLHQQFLERDCELIHDETGEFYYIRPEHVRRNAQLRKEIAQSSIAFTMVQRNFVVSLVSQFDSFLGSLIRTMFYIKPELLNSSEKSLTFANLVQYQNISDAREFIIEKEVESVLRESHSAQFKWLEDKIGAPLRKDLPIWSTFIELTERRNLYVHNDGIVNHQYINICKQCGVSLPATIKPGDVLPVDLSYFQDAFRCVFELGIKLSQVVWRRLTPKNLEGADQNILEISFELIHNGEYTLAKKILDFCDKYVNTYSSEDIKLRLVINRAQTYKWLGDESKCREIINSRDWSACKDIFRLVRHVLLDEFEQAASVMDDLGKEGEIGKTHYTDWPIFKEFVKQEVFRKKFAEIFGKPEPVTERYAQTGYKIIGKEVFLDMLHHCLSQLAEKQHTFLSSKYFVETRLAREGFDIGSSWEVYNQLEADGRIETYKHYDPNERFPPISAVRTVA